MLWALLLSLVFVEPAVNGVVKDSTGLPVSGATVIMRSGTGPEQRTVSGPDGRFEFPKSADGQVTVVVRAGGFAEKTQVVSGSQEMEIVLALAKGQDAVTVTATKVELELGDTPASVNIIDRQQIRQSPAVIADDVLRQVPTFSLFRRTSAISANPTAQGVSLRGIGPSGVSRTLVMVDNVPVNDPFGGWVYWTKVPLASVDRIELVNGSSSSLYGNYAMGGVINIASRRPTRRTIEVSPQYGSRNSPKLDVYASDVWGKVGVSVDASAFDTDGFQQVIANERGRIDTNAAVEFRNFNGKVNYNPTARISTFLRAGYFTENRDNAKVITLGCTPGLSDCIEESNSTVFRSLSLGTRIVLPDQSDLQVTAFGDSVSYHQNFLGLVTNAATDPAPRYNARTTVNQFVPTRNIGGMVQWSRALGAQHYFSAGTDWRWVKGDSHEDLMNTSTAIDTDVMTQRVSGGRQTSLGMFVQDIYKPTPKLTITGSMRLDRWRSYDAHNLETAVVPGSATNNNPALPEKKDTDVPSPRIGALYHLTSMVNVWGDYGWGFRAPTLNELYRQFRVGQTITLANDQLTSERLKGGEVGASISLPHQILLRTTWFDNRMKNPVSTKINGVSAGVTTVQRVNLGRTRIWGIQTDAEAKINEWLKVGGGYLYNQAKVTENPIDPFTPTVSLVGKYLVQVPKHRGSAQVTFSHPKIVTATLAAQFVGRQFDDVTNTGVVPGQTTPGLPGYNSVDLSLSRTIVRNVDAFFGVQNMTAAQVIVQLLPTTIGSPRMFSGGLRIRFSGK